MRSAATTPVPDGLAGERADAALASLLGFSRTFAAEVAESGRRARSTAVALGKSDRLHRGCLARGRVGGRSRAPAIVPDAGARSSRIVHHDDDIVVIDKPVGRGRASIRRVGTARPCSGPSRDAGFTHRDLRRGGARRDRAPPRCRHERADGRREERARLQRAQARVPRPRGRQDLPRGRRRGIPDPFVGHDRRPDRPAPRLELEVRGHRRRQARASPTTTRSRRCASATLLEIQLETGRTHQIRVHMAAQRHPCVGDTRCTAPTRRLPRATGAHEAVAAREEARVPSIRGTGADVQFETRYPADLQHALDVLRARTESGGRAPGGSTPCRSERLLRAPARAHRVLHARRRRPRRRRSSKAVVEQGCRRSRSPTTATYFGAFDFWTTGHRTPASSRSSAPRPTSRRARTAPTRPAVRWGGGGRGRRRRVAARTPT